MNTSIFLAQVLGLYLIIMGLFSLIRHNEFKEIISSFSRERGTLLLLAIITLIIGILLVVSHNIWVSDWRVIITILAWLIFLGGIFRLFFQNLIVKTSKWWLTHKGFFFTISAILLLVGCYLAYKGFIS